MDVLWIDEQLRARNMKRVRLVEAIPGFTEAKLSKIMNGSQKLTADEADSIRRFFGYKLPEDPTTTEVEAVKRRIDQLGDAQVRAVALYLEALLGTDSVHPPK